jgi:hypothetical protein
VGLYFPRRRFLFPPIIVPFLQIKHSFAMKYMLSCKQILCKKLMWFSAWLFL